MDRRERWLIGGTGAALILVCTLLAASDDLRHNIPRFLVLYGAAFALYVGVVFGVVRGVAIDGLSWKMILAVAVLCRLVLIPATPQLSTDVYRYLWEGRMVASGQNPFALAPEAPELERMRDGNYEAINHKDLKTIYPPLAQGAFGLGAMLRPNLTTQKVLFTLFDIATIVLLVMLLRRRSQNPALVVIYAWSPLVIFETAHSGHVDAIGIFFLMLGVWYLERDRRLLGAVAIAFSFLSKYLAAVLLPFVLMRRRLAVWIPLALLVVVVAYLPFAGAGGGLVSSLRVYGTEWHFNGLLYNALRALLHDPGWTRRILGAGVLAYAIVQAVRHDDAGRYAFHVIAAVLLAAPTLYPWYVLWVVPFLCLFPTRAWILFTGLVCASYYVWHVSDDSGQWRLPTVVYAIEYIPLYGFLFFDAMRSRRSRPAAHKPVMS